MNIFMQLVLGLGIFLMVGSAYYVIFVRVSNWEEITIFCLYAAGLIYFGCYRGVKRVLADDEKKRNEKKKK